MLFVGGGRAGSEEGANVAGVGGWVLGVVGGGGLFGFAVLVVLDVRWVGVYSQNLFFEADGVGFGFGVLGGDWINVVVGPLAVGVALVFGVEFVRAREACSDKRGGALAWGCWWCR